MGSGATNGELAGRVSDASGDGVLLGTRFLATEEAPVEAAYKGAVVASGGDDTIVTTVSTRSAVATGPAPGRACDEHASSRNGSAGSLNSADAATRSGRDSTRPKSPTPTTASCGSGSQPG